MRLLYESDSGGKITADYNNVPAEEIENIEATKFLADLGKNIILIPPLHIDGIHTNDAIIDGESWEIKTNHEPTKSAIDHALRKANKQSKKLILYIKSNISKEDLYRGIKGRILRTELEEIIIIKNETITHFNRSDFKN